MSYMLDSNIMIYALRRPKDQIHQRILFHLNDDLCISSVTYEELVHGVYRSSDPVRNMSNLQKLLLGIDILPFDDKAAHAAGRIHAELERAGTSIGNYDILIAGHAKSLNCILVTNNTREFQRVPGLQIEDWIIR